VDAARRERMSSTHLPPDNIVAVLYRQHARIRDQFDAAAHSSGGQRGGAFDELRELLATHEAAEDVVLRAVTDKLLPPHRRGEGHGA